MRGVVNGSGKPKLNAEIYTAADVLAKLLTVDGAGTGLDADKLDGQEGSYYLPAGSYTAADVLNKIKTVDGAGTGLDADLLDGQQGSYYLPAGSYTAADILAKLLTVDGTASGLDSASVDGLHFRLSSGVLECSTNGIDYTVLSAIKSIQRGVTVGAGTVTITTVDTTKSFVISVSKGSAGTVAVTGSIALTPSGGSSVVKSGGSTGISEISGTAPNYGGSISGGTTNLITKQYSAVLTNATTITVDGPVEWQVIEYN